jgi:CRP/FNR family transcriptional regulator, cyclic AMP receptor protein
MFTALDLTEGLTAEDREWLVINGKERRLSSNERLISEGDALREIYFVLSGLFSVGPEASESFSTVGPGGILGDMSFLTGNAASATVIALEEDSAVLAVSSEAVSSHLAADADFAVRFYRITAMLLSERLRNLIALFITSPAIRTETKTGPSLRGPVRLFTQNQPDFAAIQRLVNSLPPVSDICDSLQGFTDNAALAQRVQRLSVATMAAESLQLLFEVARNEGVTDLDRRVIRHEPSFSAADKQAILPGVLIQKTVTILIENKFVLCSSIGDLKISRKLLGEIAVMLGFPRRGLNTFINPVAFLPEIELGLLRGMVSTFFSPGRITQLDLVALIAPSSSQVPDVAVSLSPCESLLLPCAVFPGIVRKYAEHAYPYVPFTLLRFDQVTAPPMS